MSEKEVIERLEQLEKRCNLLQEALERIQRQLGQRQAGGAGSEEADERPWIEG